MGNCNVSGEEKRGGWCRETNLSRREKRKNIREDIRRTLVPLLHLSLLLVTRSLPRRDPQMQIFRCICLNRVDLRPFSPSCSPSIPNTTHALPFLCFSPLSLFSLSLSLRPTSFDSFPILSSLPFAFLSKTGIPVCSRASANIFEDGSIIETVEYAR